MPKKKKAKKSKKTSISKKKIAGVIAGTIIAGSSFWILKSGKHKVLFPAYSSIRVFDGDTFLTKEKESVRLASLDAPEEGYCGDKQATKLLKKLVENKPLYIKTIYVDNNKRLVSYVYSSEGLINVQMVKSGWARAHTIKDSQREALITASKYAKENELGIYSSLCFSKEPEKKGCDIKGNIRSGYKTKIYIFPGCISYTNTKVEKDLGDRWFCTEAEAKKAGFKKSSGCPDSVKRK